MASWLKVAYSQSHISHLLVMLVQTIRKVEAVVTFICVLLIWWFNWRNVPFYNVHVNCIWSGMWFGITYMVGVQLSVNSWCQRLRVSVAEGCRSSTCHTPCNSTFTHPQAGIFLALNFDAKFGESGFHREMTLVRLAATCLSA